MRTLVLYITVTFSLVACSTGPRFETTPTQRATFSVNSAHKQAARNAALAIPIDQLDSFGANTCALRAGDVYCWSHLENEPFRLSLRGPFVRIALKDPFGDFCATTPDGEIRCTCASCGIGRRSSIETGSKISDPEGTLVASKGALCALTEGGQIACEVFEKDDSAVIELAPGLEFVDLAVTSRFSKVVVAAVDKPGEVYYWRDAVGEKEPEILELPAMRSVEIEGSEVVGITDKGRAVYLDTIPRGGTFREVCGVENVRDVGIWAGDFCLRTDEGVTCVKEVGQGSIEEFAVPMHSGCRGPRGKGLIERVRASSMKQVLCVGTEGGRILCRPRDVTWPRERIRVFEHASQIASGDQFACAKLENGEVRCTSPILAHAGIETVDALRDTTTLFAGGHLVCGLDGRELSCVYLAGAAQTGSATWKPLRPRRLTRNPNGLVVTNGGISWRDSERLYMQPLYFREIAGRLVFDPRTRVRWNPRRSLKMPDDSMDFIARSRQTFLSADGEFYGISRSSLDPVVTALGIATGGLLLPAAIDKKPAKRFVVHRAAGATDLAAGPRHLCYIREDQLFCYGGDKEGRTSGAPSMRPVPKEKPLLVDFDAKVVDVSAGLAHTCALLDTGEVECWGAFGNDLLRPGDSYPGLLSVPIEIE